ncbi:MAG: dTDP-4-dehydrorhamnose 3,5-epimerase [Clostridiales bacterium]|jgi:dTDP-4-dehydrorhamnose 3,5-epimerase|nr:dTDP-4-dehydrorhamnose 3,5-epimerase [Clostridiales bacterium]
MGFDRVGKFKFVSTGIEGLTIIEPPVFSDSRGYFMETFQREEFANAGLPTDFAQDNQSMSRKGVLRGLHFQKNNPQGKVVRVIAGAVYDVGVDLRAGSQTYGKYYGVVLSAENKLQFYVPEGFAHGFLVLSDTAEFTYKCTRLYDPADEGGVLWNDPDIAVAWQTGDLKILLSDKDANLPRLRDIAHE